MTQNSNRGARKKAVIFDRDGTLIVDKIYLNDPNAIEYLPGVFAALKRLREAGFEFFVATNQSGVPRGIVSLENLSEIHRRMHAEFAKHGVEIRHFYFAPHMTDSDHFLRKPNPGMLLEAARDYNLDLGQSWMIGDKDVDVEAGRRAGARTILLAKAPIRGVQPDGVFPTILDAVPLILGLKSANEENSGEA